MSTFGERLRSERERKGFNQKQFAELLEITPTRLNYWEKDKREPNVFNIKKILQLLDIDSDYLLGIHRQNQKSFNKEETSLTNLPNDEQNLLNKYRNLNNDGKEEVMEHLEYISTRPKYIKCDSCKFSENMDA